MNKFLKRKKGITLVALVITIIILLILAGISIATLTGSELFEKARLAEQKSKNAQEKEEKTLEDYTNTINKYISTTRNENNTKIDYLVEEQDTGIKWIDGKTIYQKSYVYENCYIPKLNEPYYIDVSDINMEELIDYQVLGHGVLNGEILKFTSSGNSTTCTYNFTNKKIDFRQQYFSAEGSQAYGFELKVLTLKYTKLEA